MSERTPAFEAYIAGLKKNEKTLPTKGKVAKEGKLAVALDELSPDEENTDSDSFVSKKSSDDEQEDMAA